MPNKLDGSKFRVAKEPRPKPIKSLSTSQTEDALTPKEVRFLAKLEGTKADNELKLLDQERNKNKDPELDRILAVLTEIAEFKYQAFREAFATLQRQQ